jgi:hypothetical protein
MLESYAKDDASSNEPATRHYDLAVYDAQQQWQRIRWALFVFPDITDVMPTDDSDVVRVFYEGSRPYPDVWTVELRQRGFDLPPVDSAVRTGAVPGNGRPRWNSDRARGRRG